MYLPSLKYAEQKTKQQIVEFLGVNFSDNFTDGNFSACRNLSARRYPYLSTRLRRLPVGDYVSPTAVTAWNKLVVVDGTSLIYDGNVVGTVTTGEKQFAVVNTKLVIWPDKKYLDLNTSTLHDLGASAEKARAIVTTDSITMTGAGLSNKFSAGDGVTISGCTTKPENNKDIVIKAVDGDKLTFSSNALTACTEAGTMKIERKIPDLDFICESENRLWGVSNANKTIYASSLGDPKNFFVYQGISTDSYALAVGSAGNFTGCCKLSSSVLFWKENLLHKILGSYPAEYALYTSDITGVQEGSFKSMQVINDVLFYKGQTGCTPIPAAHRLWCLRHLEPSGLRRLSAGRTAKTTTCPPKAGACGIFWYTTPSRGYGWKRMTRRRWISAGTTAISICFPPTAPCGRWMRTRVARL